MTCSSGPRPTTAVPTQTMYYHFYDNSGAPAPAPAYHFHLWGDPTKCPNCMANWNVQVTFTNDPKECFNCKSRENIYLCGFCKDCHRGGCF